MELKLGDLVDNFNRSSKILHACTLLASQTNYKLPLAFQNARETGRRVCIRERKTKKKFNGHMIKCLLTELGRAGGKIFGSRSGRTDLAALGPDLEPNIFPSGPPTQSISTYYFYISFLQSSFLEQFLIGKWFLFCSKIRNCDRSRLSRGCY